MNEDAKEFSEQYQSSETLSVANKLANDLRIELMAQAMLEFGGGEESITTAHVSLVEVGTSIIAHGMALISPIINEKGFEEALEIVVDDIVRCSREESESFKKLCDNVSKDQGDNISPVH